MVRMGGCVFSITRTCTEEVCVRKARSGSFSMKKVSCMSRAGCSSGKFRAVKLWKSSSISGPSETVNPMREKMSMISLRTMESGWRVPRGAVAGSVRSKPLPSPPVCWSRRSFNATILFCTDCFSTLIICPSSRRCSGGTDLKSAKSAGIIPFLLKNLIRKASSCSVLSAEKASTSFNNAFILSFMVVNCLKLQWSFSPAPTVCHGHRFLRKQFCPVHQNPKAVPQKRYSPRRGAAPRQWFCTFRVLLW